jgi:hypothetical protein
MGWITLGILFVVILVVAFLVDRRNRRTFNNDVGHRPEERMSPENHPGQGSGGGSSDWG